MNANVGMVCPVCAPVSTYTEGTSITYSAGMVLAEAVGATLTWERSDGKFYGDDVELDSDRGITGYTIDFEPSGITDAARATLLGEVADASTTPTGEYTITDANPPEVGFGYVRRMRASGQSGVADSYEAWWFYRMKFALNTEETRTKEQSIEWRTPTLNGTGYGVRLSSADTNSFCIHKTFSTKADAIGYVKTKAGIST